MTALALTLVFGVLDLAPKVRDPNDEPPFANIITCHTVRILEHTRVRDAHFSYTYVPYKICWALGVSHEELCEQLILTYPSGTGLKICEELTKDGQP